MNRLYLIALIFLVLPSISFGQMLSDPLVRSGNDRITVEGGFAKSKVEYDLRSVKEIDRTWLFGDLGFGVTASTDIFGTVGISLKSKYEGTSLDGQGLMIGGGTRSNVYSKGSLNLSIHAQASYIDETFKGSVYYVPTGEDVGDAKIDFDVFEILFGGLVSYQIQPKFALYGGLELIPYSDGDAKATANIETYKANASSDVERSDIFNLRLGAQALLGEVKIHPYMIIFGETTFGIAASVKL